jgi:Tol biopolymer transport system component
MLIPRGDNFDVFYPVWFSEGKAVLFSEIEVGKSSRSRLMVWNEQYPLTAHVIRNGSFGTHADFSPDGNWIVYEDEISSRTDYDIYLLKSDGTGPITAITDSRAMDFDPVWRP